MTSGGGFTFGTPQPTLGSTQTNPLFGSTPSFGGQTTQSFGFGGTQSTTNPSSSSFNFQPFTSTATSSSLPAFGSTQTPFTFSNPTQTTSTTQPFNFGGLGGGQQNTGTGLGSSSMFGVQRPQQAFGSTFMGTSIGQPQPQQPTGYQMCSTQIPQNVNIFAPKIYNDERDEIIAQFNKVQAFWGSGKAFYSAFMPPIEISQTDPYHRFKTIGYSEYKKSENNETSENKIGFLVKMVGDESQLKTSLLTYEQNLKSIISANLVNKLEITKVLPENRAVLSLSVMDPTSNKPLSCVQLQNYFNQQNIKNQLNNIFLNTFLNLVPLAAITRQELEEYLNNPPKGIDERLWAQAKHENPDPNRFIPVPLVGFAALNERFKLQERETEQHKMRLKIISDNVSSLERHVSETKSKLDECRRKHISLSNRVLKIMINQEVMRKRGFPIQAEEDQLKSKLEAIQSELSAPTKFQGCLNELMSQLRQMQSQHPMGVSVSLDSSLMNELKVFLRQEQEGIEHLISILRHDMTELQAIKSQNQSTNSSNIYPNI